jgi:FkbH-like protein
MSTTSSVWLDEIMSSSVSRREFAERLRPIAGGALSLREIKKSLALLRQFPEETTPVRIAVLSTYTTELLRDYWDFHALLHGLELDIYSADYGQVAQEFRDSSKLATFAPDVTYILMQWHDIVPALGDPTHALNETEKDELIGLLCSGLRDLIAAARSAVDGTIVVSFLPPTGPSGLGSHDVMTEYSDLAFRSKMKQVVQRLLSQEFAAVHFDDGDELAATAGLAGWFDPRLWYSSRFPFSVAATNLFIHRLVRFPVLMNTPKLKCIVLDCDNTLWGGIIGEDGMSGIALGSEYPGACYMAFQRRLLDFLYRGYLLAICSKNNTDDVLRVLREHPSMLLREDAFAALRIGWEPKPDNLRSMSEELQLGLDSFLFVDDSPHECRMMRTVLPEVRVATVPEKPIQVPTCLDHLQELEVLSYTDEDRTRSGMYVQNRERTAMAVMCGDLTQYLTSLEMRMIISRDDEEHVPRLAQLTQKTNQFNLTTKRYGEDEILPLVSDPDWLVADFSLSDIFGESGIVGLLLASGMTGENVNVDTFLMSCRVIGRKAEEAFLQVILRHLWQAGKHTVTGAYVPTSKNALVKSFWQDQGFTSAAEGSFTLDLAQLSETHSAMDYFHIDLSGQNI